MLGRVVGMLGSRGGLICSVEIKIERLYVNYFNALCTVNYSLGRLGPYLLHQ